MEMMPKMQMTPKGERILAKMKKMHGDKEGERMFRAHADAGIITHVYGPRKSMKHKKEM